MSDKRNRRTRQEMLAHYLEKAQRLQDQIDGREVGDADGGVLKALKRRLRKTETAFRAAQIMVNGVVKEDGKGWQRAPISEKIETTRARLETQLDSMHRAEAQSVSLPYDVERLQALVQAAELGEEVEMPTDLTPLGAAENKPSDEEIEASFIAGQEATEVF